MATSPSSSAQAAREALGARLREIMRNAGLDGVRLAARAGWHASKSSRLTTGTTLPSPADFRTWCAVCGADDQVEDLLARSRDVDSLYVELKRRHRGGLRRLQESYTAEFEGTRRFREYRCDVLPGFAQTHAYAQALLASVARFDRIPDDSQEAATARLARSSIVRTPGERTFVLLIDEAVLHHRIADDAVMAEQLDHLLTLMTFPAVSVGIVPLRARRDSILPLESFLVLDDSQVHIELLTAEIRVTAPSEVDGYLRAFAELTRLAVHGARARACIGAAMNTLV
ncbi:helix-turn-helix domain-containing protein [Embleya sp. MST-111070]|uniref:helix-turn-helix domain-containing protein n=1 Tax=Embleya sp. MST-111070 TaxID=3398231 RepID=UPI003F74188A